MRKTTDRLTKTITATAPPPTTITTAIHIHHAKKE